MELLAPGEVNESNWRVWCTSIRSPAAADQLSTVLLSRGFSLPLNLVCAGFSRLRIQYDVSECCEVSYIN